MRAPRLILVFILLISLTAHTQVPGSAFGYTQQNTFFHNPLLNDSNSLKKNWSVSVYGGLGAGIGFFNGGTSTGFFPAQIGLQLNRRLTNNLYAFTGVSTTPVFNFNRPFNNGPYKNYMGNSAFGPNGFGMYQQIQAGLMYVNDDKTFSISGSIGIGSSRFPAYPSNATNTQRQHFAAARP